MSRGTSGRVVLEIDPELKSELYSVLALRSLTLKSWFVAQAKEYVRESRQPRLALSPSDRRPRSR